MKSLFETIGGLFQLIRLLASTGFRRHGAYWSWRDETAFGSNSARMPSAAQRRRAILDYARWVQRMRSVGP